MDWQDAFNIAFALAGFLGGWVLKSLGQAMRDLQIADFELTRKVQSIEVLVAGQYVRRDELKDVLRDMASKLDRIENKLDEKADKP